jgi:hypothetical protein
LFLTAALSFKKGFSTRTLSEFGREPLLLVLKFQLNPGHPLTAFGHEYVSGLDVSVDDAFAMCRIERIRNLYG